MPVSKHNRLQYVGLAALFLVLLCLCWLFPLTGDDWFREALGLNIHSLSDLIQEVAYRWRTTNARILGNVLSYSAGGRKLLMALLRSAIILGIVYGAAEHAGFRSLRGILLTAAALFALPREMFRQIYPWAAGFFNYVPPVLLLLASFQLLGDVFDEKPLKTSAPRAAAVFLLGFGGQLFMENDTLYAICAGFVLLVWYGSRQKKLSPVLLSFFTGTVLGAALLFASPSYRLVGQSGEYSVGLLSMLRANQREVFRYLISGCPVLFVSLTVLGLVWFSRSKRQRLDWAAAAVLVLGCLYFAVNCLTPLWTRANPLVALLWGLSLGFGCWRWMPRGGRLNRALFFWASSAVAAFPMLFVSPVGPRCLYLSYVCLLLTAGNMLSALPLEKLPVPATGAVSALLAAAVLGFYFWLFVPIHRTELARTAAVEAAMEAGQTEVALPAYPHGDYLWDGDSVKIQYRYYYETPGDLAVTYIPADQWDGWE